MSSSEEGWYIAEPDGTTFGPMTRNAMSAAFQRRVHSAQALAWHVDIAEWRLLSAFANNSDFVVNALDNLTGSSYLIGMRSRATYTRPFERVEALRRKADADFRSTEQSLQDQLTETERKLTELQSQRKDGENLMILSDEQRQEIERFQQQKLEIRKELRQVRRNLLSDIDNLGTWLKVINVMLVPLLVALLALGVFVMRNRRRSAT